MAELVSGPSLLSHSSDNQLLVSQPAYESYSIMLDTQTNGIASLSGAFLFLSTATLALRLFAPRKQGNRLSYDNYAAVLAWVGFVGLTALAFHGASKSFIPFCPFAFVSTRKEKFTGLLLLKGISQGFIGHHQPKDKAIVAAQHPTMERVFLSIDALNAFGTTKISALFFFRRIFCTPGHRDLFYWATIVFIGIVMGWIITFVIFPFQLCGKHSLEWAVQPGHSALCTLTYPYFDANAISDFILDVLVVTLPLPKIWSLHITKSQKMATTAVFALALVGVGASCARMVIYGHLVRTGRAINDQDGYQTNTQMAYYAIFEAAFTVTAINLPPLWLFTVGISPGSMLRSVRSLVSGRSRQDSYDSKAPSKKSIAQASDDGMGTSKDIDDIRPVTTKPSLNSCVVADATTHNMANADNRIVIERHFNYSEEWA